MTRVPGILWAWLCGYWRPETVAESTLRRQLLERDGEIAFLRHRVAQQEGEIAVHKNHIDLLTDVVERNRRRVQAEAAAAAYHTIQAGLGRERHG